MALEALEQFVRLGELPGPAGEMAARALPGAPSREGPLVLRSDQEHRLLQQLRHHYDEARQNREEIETRRTLRYRRYLADPTLRVGQQLWEDGPQLFLPLTRKTIETLKDEFTEALGGVEAITVRGIGEEDVLGATLKTRFLQHALTEINPMHWDEVLDSALHDALQDSLGIVKVYPYAFPFPHRTITGQLLHTIVRIERTDEGTLLIPPNATGLQWPECPYLGQQLWPSLDEFPSMRRRGFQVPDAEEVRVSHTEQQYTDDERKLLEFTRVGSDPDLASGEWDARVEMVESYELFALEPGADRIFIVAHWFPNLRGQGGRQRSGHLARCMALDEVLPQEAFVTMMWPFFPLTVWPQGGQLRGLNVVDRLESVQDMLNRLAEQMIEQGEVDILPYVFANIALAGDVPNLRRIRPGDVVPLDSMGSVTFSPRQSNVRHFAEQMQIGRAWAEEDIGVTAFVQGRSADQPNAPRTLGGLSLSLQQSHKGFKKQTHHLARQIKPIQQMYLGLWHRHVAPQLHMPVPNMEGLATRLFAGQDDTHVPLRPITPQMLAGPFDITIQVNPEAYLEQQKRLVLAEKLDGILAPIWPLGRRELWKDLWQVLGLQEFERFYPEGVAVVQTMILMLQAQMQLAQLEAALGGQLGMGSGESGMGGEVAGLTPGATALATLLQSLQATGQAAGQEPGPQAEVPMPMAGSQMPWQNGTADGAGRKVNG